MLQFKKAEIYDSKNIGHFLKQLREEKNITQEELSQLLFIYCTTITKIENNKRIATTEQLQQFSKYFDISVTEILNRERLNTVRETDKITTKLFYNNLRSQKYLKAFIVTIIILLIIKIIYIYVIQLIKLLMVATVIN